MKTIQRTGVAVLAMTLFWTAVLCGGAGPGQEKRERAAKGTWGGSGVQLEVQDEGAQVEFDCARGEVTEALVLDKQGRFEARGTYVRERMGPDREGEPGGGEAARYSGHVSGKTMELTVALTHSGETVGSFTLTHGRAGRLHKCQ